jgi:hypothetical protein
MGAILRRDGRLAGPTQLAPKGGLGAEAQLGADSRGRMSLVFSTQTGVYARFGRLPRGFGKRVQLTSGDDVPIAAGPRSAVFQSGAQLVEAVPAADGSLVRRVLFDPSPNPLIGFEDDGGQVAVWEQGSEIIAAARAGGGPFESRLEVPGGNPALAVTPSGRSAIAWQTDGRVSASIRRTGSAAFGPPIDVALDATLRSADLAPSGSAALGVVGKGGNGVKQAQVVLVSPGGRQKRTLVVTTRNDVADVRVLRDARGTLAAVTTNSGLEVAWAR